MATTINENTVRDVVSRVLGELGKAQVSSRTSPQTNGSLPGGNGAFGTVDAAVKAADEAQERLLEAGLGTRAKAVQCIQIGRASCRERVCHRV